MTTIRPAYEADLPAINAIRSASAEAAQWLAGGAEGERTIVAEVEGRVVGFLIGRTVAPGEHEILNLAVAPEFRRRGIARLLLQDWVHSSPGTVFLEVRESNLAARNLYKYLGFEQVGVRTEYYIFPSEAAIVLRFHSC
jgi:ribosomal-protein-alanine N-acetyltransferase